MRKINRVFIALGVMIGVVLGQMGVGSGIALGEDSGFQRFYGSDRYYTAVAISQQGWQKSYYAVLARGDEYADALCAGPLAKRFGAPILLTESQKLNQATLGELKRLGVRHVFITGGPQAIGEDIENQLFAAGITAVERLYGSDRYETAVKIAAKIGTADKVVLATGSGFADALSISAVAACQEMPILLTSPGTLPESVKNFLSEKNTKETYLIGGAGVVIEAVAKLLPHPTRLGGTDRYETNALVMKHFAQELDFRNIFVAVGNGPNGNEFADALAGAVLAARHSAPVLLVYKDVPKVSGEFIKSKVSIATKVTALGGEGVVPVSILNTLTSYVKNVEVKENYSKAGTYGPAEGTATIAGNVIIGVRDVTLQNTVIEGDLLLAEGIGDGNVTLKNVTVKGITTVRGGGPNSVVMYNFNGQTVVVDVPDGSNVRLVAQGSTSISNVIMDSNGNLVESELTGSGFNTVEIPEGAEVILSGDFNSVVIENPGANVNLTSGTITNLTIGQGASNAEVNIGSGASVGTLQADAPAQITGTGAINTANINSQGVSIAQTPTTTNVGQDITTTVGGNTMSGPPAPSYGGGGSDSRAPSIKSIAGLSKTGFTDSGLEQFWKLLDVDAVYTLPSTAIVNMSDYTEQAKQITWTPATVDTSVEGEFIFTGKVDSYSKDITLKIKVKQILSDQVEAEFVIN